MVGSHQSLHHRASSFIPGSCLGAKQAREAAGSLDFQCQALRFYFVISKTTTTDSAKILSKEAVGCHHELQLPFKKVADSLTKYIHSKSLSLRY